MINRKVFFDSVRATLFNNKLNQTQVDGLTTILDTWEASSLIDLRQLSYVLATSYWETARTISPIKEIGSNTYFFKMYDPKGLRPAVASRLGNIVSGDGVRFCGRGFVQLTGRTNYQKMSTIVGVDLVAEPDLAMRTDIAAHILFYGMEHGIFTGKKLSDYINESKCDYVGARRVINGVDKNNDIAAIAIKFQKALIPTS